MAASSAISIRCLTHSSPWSGTRPGVAQASGAETFAQARSGTSSSSMRQRQAAAFDRNRMAVAGIGAHTVDGDEGRTVDAEPRSEIGILDDFEPQGPGLGIGAGIGQRLRPADRCHRPVMPSKVTNEPMPTLVVISPRLDSPRGLCGRCCG